MKNIKLFESYIAMNEDKTLFGDIDEYKERFTSMEGFTFAKPEGPTAAIPNHFPELDLKSDTSKYGWNYTTLRAYRNEDPSSVNKEAPRNQGAIEFGAKFENTKELLDFVIDKVIGPNKKEWKASTVRKSSYKTSDNKNDKYVAFQHPALGFIIFGVVDSALTRRSYKSGPSEYRFQVMAYFMNEKKHVGKISNYSDLDKKVDNMLDGLDPEEVKAVWNYIKQKHGNYSW